MEITLQAKQGSAWTNDLGQTFPQAPLYRFVSMDDTKGCWYSTLEQAENSWNRRHPEALVSAVDALEPTWLVRPAL